MGVTQLLADALTTIAAVVVGVLSVARLTRLITADTWPPVLMLRQWWDKVTTVKEGPGKGAQGAWYDLVSCPYCAAPWLTIPILAWALISDLHWSWWVVNGWLAAAYVASMIVARDGE
jgi:hypothetical protein